MIYIMLDDETMGVGTSPALTEVAAIAFTEHDKEVATFHVGVDLQSSLDAGLKVKASTVNWWVDQVADARESFKRSQEDCFQLKYVISAFMSFIEKARGMDSKGQVRVVGNGTMADNRWMCSAAEALGIELEGYGTNQIAHWEHFDLRTFVETVEMATGVNVKENAIEFNGVKHNPLDDCRHQISYMLKGMELLKNERSRRI